MPVILKLLILHIRISRVRESRNCETALIYSLPPLFFTHTREYDGNKENYVLACYLGGKPR